MYVIRRKGGNRCLEYSRNNGGNGCQERKNMRIDVRNNRETRWDGCLLKEIKVEIYVRNIREK